MRSVIRSFGWTMIWSGTFLFLFLGYQLWGTGLRTSGDQRLAEAELTQQFAVSRESLSAEVIASADAEVILDDEGKFVSVVAPGPEDTGPPVLTEEEPAEEDTPFGTIRFPTLETQKDQLARQVGIGELADEGQSWVMFEGVSVRTLKRGPGHMPDTSLPGQPGNAVISGHRTTYLAPFNRLDELEAGDPIIVETAIGTHVYVVRDPAKVVPADSYLAVGEGGGWFSVRPTALWVTDEREGSWLTLTTCHPEFSARQRLIVVAELVSGPNHAFIYGEES